MTHPPVEVEEGKGSSGTSTPPSASLTMGPDSPCNGRTVTPSPRTEQKPKRVAVLLALLVLDIVATTTITCLQHDSFPQQLEHLLVNYKEMGRWVGDVWVLSLARCAVVAAFVALDTSTVLDTMRGMPIATIAFLFSKVYSRAAFHQDTSAVPFAIAMGIAALFPIAEFAVAARIYKLPSEETGDQGRRFLPSLATLRFLCAVHIVIYHFNKGGLEPSELNLSSNAWNRFAMWGGSELTFFFCLSGFVLAYQYSKKDNIPQLQFWLRRFAKLYPFYLATILMGVAVVAGSSRFPSSAVSGHTVVVMLLCLQTWVSSVFENDINTPSWAVGAFLFLYAIFPPVLTVLKTASQRLRWYLMILFWAFTVLGAGNAMGHNWTGIYGPVCHTLFAAHTPAFFFGMCLGVNFFAEMTNSAEQAPLLEEEVEDEGPPKHHNIFVRYCLASTSLAGLIAIMCTANVFGNDFLAAWAPNGMLLPLYGGLIWGAATGYDPLCYLLSPFQYLGHIALCVYLAQAPLHTFGVVHMGFHDGQWGDDAWVFAGFLLCWSVVGYHLIEVPCANFLSSVFSSVSAVRVPRPPLPEPLLVLGYYLLFVTIVGGYIWLSLSGIHWGEWDSIVNVSSSHTADVVVDSFKWLALLSLPALAFTTVGHLFIPPARRVKVPELTEMLDESNGVPHMRHRLHFRIVTRGLHPLLVAENVANAARVLESCLPREKYVVEVVADNPMELHKVTSYPVDEITVPKEYKTREVDPAKYKARALNYAIFNSSAKDGDWIIHLDEETQFTPDTVKHIYYHCAVEEEAVARGEREYPRIGQGPILYGHNHIENYLTTLADSIRVADDFGKFRLQYAMHEPLIGMHGSFVVCAQQVERETTFNHGMVGSITEDAYFALVARAKGVRFSWVDAFMYEQSPFSVLDFVKQRKRWFAGLWLVVKASEIPFRFRGILGAMVFTWAVTPVIVLAMLLCMIVGSNVSLAFRVLLSCVASLSCWGYMLGFVWTFSPYRGGWVRFIVLGFFQWILQPFFAIMEIWGVLYAIVDRSAYTGFHIVQKESKELKARHETDAAPVYLEQPVITAAAGYINPDV